MSQKKKTYEFNKQTPIAPKAVKKIETDEILSGSDKMAYHLSVYWKQIVTGLAILVAVVVVLIVVKFVRENNDLQLRHQFADAATVEELVALTDANADHVASIPALFRLGGEYAKVNDHKNAAEAYKKIYNSAIADDFQRMQACLAAAYHLELAADDAAALALFIAATNDPAIHTSPLMLQEAVYNAARLNLKAGKKDQAEAMLKKINPDDRNTAGFWQEQCKKLLQQVAGK